MDLSNRYMTIRAIRGPLDGQTLRVAISFFETMTFTSQGMKGYYSLVHPHIDKRGDMTGNWILAQRSYAYWHDLGPVEMPDGWMNLEYAPKDGTMVEVMLLDGSIVRAYYMSNHAAWYTSDGIKLLTNPKVWRKIDALWSLMITAPKDGTQIRVRTKEGDVVNAHYAFKHWYSLSKSNGYVAVDPIEWSEYNDHTTSQ